MTEAELLEAIWQRPDDDGPRLIYADWLQERGDPRGEFIQLQCNPRRTAAAGERERALERQHARAWSAPFLERGVRVVVFRRGLPAFLAADGLVFSEHGEELLRLAPIDSLSLFSSKTFHSLQRLYALPEFARIKSLALSQTADGDASARELATAPFANGLRELNLWQTGLTSGGVEALASSPHFTQLEDLGLGGQRIGPDGVTALARSNLRALTQVSFYECDLRGDDWRALEDCPAFARIKRFLLGGNFLGDEGVSALSRSSELRALEELDLSRHSVTDKGVAALARWPGLSSLRTLNLSNNSIGAEGARALAGSPHLAGLLHLDLSNNSLGAAGGMALAESTTLRSLVSLKVARNDLGVAGVTAFVQGSGLPSLRELSISPNGIYTGTYTEHSDWDGTVTGSSADEEGSQETKARFVSKPQWVVH